MSEPLRVLVVDDSANDAALLAIQLERMGFELTTERVQTAEAFAAALDRTWDPLESTCRHASLSIL